MNMAMAEHGKLRLKIDLFGKLAVAQNQKATGRQGRTLKQVVRDLIKRL